MWFTSCTGIIDIPDATHGDWHREFERYVSSFAGYFEAIALQSV
jgi:hypothetical protein